MPGPDGLPRRLEASLLCDSLLEFADFCLFAGGPRPGKCASYRQDDAAVARLLQHSPARQRGLIVVADSHARIRVIMAWVGSVGSVRQHLYEGDERRKMRFGTH